MKKITLPMLALTGVFCALQVQADDRQIDWSMVPGPHGRNDVTKDFVAPPDPLNVILSNSFTAWEPDQSLYAQAKTSTGRRQRLAVVGTPSENATASNVSYSETVVTTQSAPEAEETNARAGTAGNEPIYSEKSQAQTQEQAQSGQTDQASQSTQTMTKSETMQAQTPAQAEAKSKLAPHTLIMESSLNSAMDQVRGMKGELGISQDIKKADQAVVQTYKTFIREMKNDINVARTHEKKLMSDVRRYPDLASSDEFKSVNPALRDLQSTLNAWESKAKSAGYWSNQKQAKMDLDNLERQLNNALDKVKNFSSSKLNASIG
jgi:hypothetical protein